MNSMLFKYANISDCYGVTHITTSNDDGFKEFAKYHYVMIEVDFNVVRMYKVRLFNEDNIEDGVIKSDLILISNNFQLKVE